MTDEEEPYGSTPLDPEEKTGLKFKHVTTRGELNHLEQANIQSGLRWLEGRKTDRETGVLTTDQPGLADAGAIANISQ